MPATRHDRTTEGTSRGGSTPSARDRAVSRRGHGDAAVARRRRVRPVDRAGAAAPLQRREARGPASRPRAPNLLIVESDSVKGPVFDLPLRVHRIVPRRPQQRRHRGRDRGRDPGAARAGPQRERGRRDHDRADVRGEPLARARRSRRARGRGLRRAARSPTSATGRGSSAAGPSASSGSARSGRAAKWRFEGVGMRVLSFDPYNPDATHNDDLDAMLARVRRRVGARGRHARDRGHHGRGAVRGDEAGRDLHQLRARDVARHRRARRRAAVGSSRRRRASTTSSARTCRPTIRCAR